MTPSALPVAVVSNPGGKDRAFIEGQTEDGEGTWRSVNYLLNFSMEEYEQLCKSGFTEGWFSVHGYETTVVSTYSTVILSAMFGQEIGGDEPVSIR